MTISELEYWLETISKIIFDIKITISNAERLLENKYSHEENIKNHGFFKHHYYQLWFIMTIQLCKLLSTSRNQKFNLNLLFDNLEIESLHLEINNLLLENKKKLFVKVFREISDLEKAVSILRNKLDSYEDIISKLNKSRNKLYAHRDKDVKPENITLDEMKKLLEFCIDSYNTIRGGIFDISINFNNTSSWNIDYILKECSYSKSIKIEKTRK